MGLGSTAKKVQQMVDMGEELYNKLNEVRAQLNDLRGTVEDTGDRVEALETEVANQRAVLDALAEKEGIDVDAIRETETGAEASDPAEGETSASGQVESSESDQAQSSASDRDETNEQAGQNERTGEPTEATADE